MSRRRRNPPSDPGGGSPWDSLYPTLDLHGKTAEEAERSAERWLMDRRDEGDPTVRLITGRGLHSVGLPVLPSAIEGLLLRLTGSLVRRHEREAGGGVFRVSLTRGDPPPAPGFVGSARLDPELVRRAEEVLHELGIEPTALLVEIEVRRMQKEGGLGRE